MVSKSRTQTLDCDSVVIHLLSKMWQDGGCTAAAHPQINKVRRNLFGLSRAENRICDQRLTDMAAKSSQEWNFDFVNDTPRSGRYAWERVPCSDVPLCYTTTNKLAAFKDATRTIDSGRDAISPRSPKQSFKKRPLVQTSMKDYTRVQKRRSSSRLRMKQLKNLRRRRNFYTTMLET